MYEYNQKKVCTSLTYLSCNFIISLCIHSFVPFGAIVGEGSAATAAASEAMNEMKREETREKKEEKNDL